MDSTLTFADDLPASTISSRVRRGELVRLATGVYTSDVASEPADVVRREWHTIAGRLLPGAVITDRSAPVGGPVDGFLYLARDGRDREVALPGLTLLARPGAGPLEGDVPLPGGLHQASKGRALVENTRASRARGGRRRRTLDESELGDWVDRLCQLDGEKRLAQYREHAERIAPALGAPEHGVTLLRQMIGAALGTQRVDTASRALSTRQLGQPHDQDRWRLFSTLIDALHASSPQNRSVLDPRDARYTYLPFYEAYFSNFIEGTEFELAEALAVVYENMQIPGRTQDSHDLLGTYRIVSDLDEMSIVPADADEFIQLLRARHTTIMAGRPEMRPGQFKESANRAGESLFVLPALVEGTLRAGFARMEELDTAFERAVYTMFLVSEVHPFDDGNGRLARVMMNAALVAGGQSRIVVPTVYRDDYLGALRRLTRHGDASILIKVLRYANDYTSQVDFTSSDGAAAVLLATNAFNDPDSDRRLQLPRGLGLDAGATSST